MRADNSHHVITAARRRSQVTRRRAVAALRRIDNAGLPITVDTIAREAGVSRSWIYSQPDLRAEIDDCETGRPTARRLVPTASAAQTTPCCTASNWPHNASASWRPTTSGAAKNSPKPSASAASPGPAHLDTTRRDHESRAIGPC